MEPLNVVENDQTRIRWDFQIPTDKMVMANQRDIVMVDKQQKKAAVINAAIPSDTNIRKKEHEKPEKSQWLKEKAEENVEGEGHSGISSSSRSISISLSMEPIYDITKGKRQ